MARALRDPDTYIARTSGVYKIRGKVYRFIVGQSYSRQHPLVVAFPDKFRPFAAEQFAPLPEL